MEQHSYWESSSSWSQSRASTRKMTRGDLPDFQVLDLDCRNVNGPMLISRCGPCTIVGGDVLLYYWPVETALSSSNITKEPKSGSLVTIVTEENTFTSPTVFPSFYKPYAMDSCGSWHASNRNAILTMSSDAISGSVLGCIFWTLHFFFFFGVCRFETYLRLGTPDSKKRKFVTPLNPAQPPPPPFFVFLLAAAVSNLW